MVWEQLPTLAMWLLCDLGLPCLTLVLAAALLLPSWYAMASWHTMPPWHTMASFHPAIWLGHFWQFCSRSPCWAASAFYGVEIYDLQSTPPSPACKGPFVTGCLWSRTAYATSPATAFGLLSTGLHAYKVLQALGYGLNPVLFWPWPW